MDSLRERVLRYLEPLRNPPPANTPPNYLPVDLSHASWVRIHADPPIYTCDDFLTADECERIIGAEGQRLQRSKTAGDDARAQAAARRAKLTGGPQTVRSSSSCTLHHQWPSMAPLSRKIELLTRKEWTHLEPAAVTRYLKGEEYTEHQDGTSLNTSLDAMTFFAHGGQRVGTVLCYLNDVQEGGATAFPSLGIEVRPKRGKCLLFFPGHMDGRLDTRVLHAARPALDTKWVCQVWVRAHMDPIRSLKPPRWPPGVDSMQGLLEAVLA
jgi:prolyl 4-hydroxylase